MAAVQYAAPAALLSPPPSHLAHRAAPLLLQLPHGLEELLP